MVAIAEDIGRLNFPLITRGWVSRLHIRRVLAAVPAHPPLLVLPAIPANAAVRVRGVGAMLQVVTAGCGQCGLERGRPSLVGLGESPHLLGG